jgi:hypothetical protein
MGLFSKRVQQERVQQIVPLSILNSLAGYGEACLSARQAGQSVTDPQFDWAGFIGPVHMAMMNGQKEEVIAELYDAAISSSDRERATMGAYRLLADFDHDMTDSRYLEMLDASLALMRSMGLSGVYLTGFENRRVGELGA